MVEHLRRFIGGRALTAALASALTLGVVYAGAEALASHDANTIHGCAKNANGQLRVVDDAGECTAAETSIDWAQSLDLSVTKRTVSGTVAGGTVDSVEASCEAGEVVTGGGYDVGSIAFSDKVITNGPLDEDTWVVGVFNDAAFEIDVFVSILCAESGA